MDKDEIRIMTLAEYERWNDGPNRDHIAILLGGICGVSLIIAIVMDVFFGIK